MKTQIKRIRAYTFDKNGYPINSRGKIILTSKITASFKQSANNEGSRVTWLTK